MPFTFREHPAATSHRQSRSCFPVFVGHGIHSPAVAHPRSRFLFSPLSPWEQSVYNRFLPFPARIAFPCWNQGTLYRPGYIALSIIFWRSHGTGCPDLKMVAELILLAAGWLIFLAFLCYNQGMDRQVMEEGGFVRGEGNFQAQI
jgi:hypothetical protein